MDNLPDTTDGLISPEDMAAIDTLIAKSSAATDAGDYRAALLGFLQAIELAREHFGETSHLTELERTIAELKALLEK